MENSAFNKVDDGLWECLYKFPGGNVRTSIIKLDRNAYLVYSPGKGISHLAKDILKDADKIFLLAPNCFHNMGLIEWRETFGKAVAMCAEESKKRIQKKVGVELASLSVMKGFLGDCVEVFPLPGTKSGETIIRYHVGGKIYWFIADAFFNFKRLSSNPVASFLMKLNRMGPGLATSRVFKVIGIKNIDLFLSSLVPLLDEEGHHVLVPCHGRIDDSGDFNERASRLLGMIYL